MEGPIYLGYASSSAGMALPGGLSRAGPTIFSRTRLLLGSVRGVCRSGRKRNACSTNLKIVHRNGSPQLGLDTVLNAACGAPYPGELWPKARPEPGEDGKNPHHLRPQPHEIRASVPPMWKQDQHGRFSASPWCWATTGPEVPRLHHTGSCAGVARIEPGAASRSSAALKGIKMAGDQNSTHPNQGIARSR
jgi:hypothetical protein